MDWYSDVTGYIVAMAAKVNDFRMNGQYCDVTVRVGKKCFECHRLILSAASGYFRTMFNGNFQESNSPEIILHEIEADLFEKILQFMYTGQLIITASNFYSILNASLFYQLSHLEKSLIKYLRFGNKNPPIDNVFKVFALSLHAGNNELVNVITDHIHRHLDHFSRTSEFLEMPSHELEEMLKRIKYVRGPTYVDHDSLALAILRWTEHKDENYPNSTRVYLKGLIMRFIDVTEVSLVCKELIISRINRREIAKPIDTPAINAFADVFAPLKVHVFLNSMITSDSSTQKVAPAMKVATSFFGQALKPSPWDCSSHFTMNFCDFFRTSVFDNNHVYSLRYFSQTRVTRLFESTKMLKTTNGSSQIFSLNSTTSLNRLFSYTRDLEPPPRIVETYDMCGMDNRIFLFDKCCSVDRNFVYSRTGEVFRDVNIYIRDVDKWLPVPQPSRLRPNAYCMTCDEQVVYLIGNGTGDSNYAQFYDHRCPRWIGISTLEYMQENTACCARNGKIYVSGGTRNGLRVEVYDKVAGKWNYVSDVSIPRSYHNRITYGHSSLTAGVLIRPHQNMDLKIMSFNEQWAIMLPPVYEAITRNGGRAQRILDTVFYKTSDF